MNKPIPLYKRKWRGMPRIHVVVQHDNEPTQWIPFVDVAGWIVSLILIVAALVLSVR